MNLADRLCEKIIKTKNPSVVGLDPEWEKLPECYKENGRCAKAILTWACDIIDTVADIVSAVKPQMAFYEAFGGDGVSVFEKIVKYAHNAGLIVIDDSKRGDIGNTAKAYAKAHLAKDGPINADFLTVSPFLGTDSISPFTETAMRDDKGIFILVKTSNKSSNELSEAVTGNGQTLCRYFAEYTANIGATVIGKYGYSPIGAVVGATYPTEARELRRIMPHSIFLVPGYGAQGGTANDIVPCFNKDGLGAVVNSSRGITYSYISDPSFNGSREEYLKIVRHEAEQMRNKIYSALKTVYVDMKY